MLFLRANLLMYSLVLGVEGQLLQMASFALHSSLSLDALDLVQLVQYQHYRSRRCGLMDFVCLSVDLFCAQTFIVEGNQYSRSRSH